MEEEYKNITLLCALPYCWNNLVLAIGSATKSMLKFEDVVALFLSKEMRTKSMDFLINYVLSMRDHSQERNKRFSAGKSKSRGRFK